MANVVADNGLAQHVEIFLAFKLCGVAPDEGHFRHVTKQVLEAIHLREYVDAIDATARPEVDHHKLAFQLLVEGPRLVILRVQPRNAIRNSCWLQPL